MILTSHSSSEKRSQQVEVSRIIVLGDSLSDTGRMLSASESAFPSKKSYWQGRFTDGFAWPDYLARFYNTTANNEDFMINRSIGGAVTYPYPQAAREAMFEDVFKPKKFIEHLQIVFMASLEDEIKQVEKKTKFKSDDLVIIWLGANDILWVAEKFDPELNSTEIAKNAANSVRKGIVELEKKGVKNLLVVGLPNLDLSPRFNSNPSKGKTIFEYNNQLKNVVDTIRKDKPANGKNFADKNIYFVDADAMFMKVSIQ